MQRIRVRKVRTQMNIEFKEIKERSPDSGIRVIRKVNGKLRE